MYITTVLSHSDLACTDT